jgi:hypothetical protein
MENGKKITIADSELTKEFKLMWRNACNTGHDFVDPQNKDCVDPPKDGPAGFVQVEQMETTCRIHRWEVTKVKHWLVEEQQSKRGIMTMGFEFTQMVQQPTQRNLQACWLMI